MIDYTLHILDNGLTLICHREPETPLVTVNILYGVGSRDEDPTLTGFAHLFEHLMFGGTKAVPDYDSAVSMLGGEANAVTNTDYTNYYLTVPARHIEAALQLEADRMRGLNLSTETLSVQQRVVTEEYNQRYMNQPYGDVWMLLRPLCYKVHPYRWCTIGADIRHVQRASIEDVQLFFERHYHPSNAIISIAGNIDPIEAARLVEHHFGTIKDGGAPCRAKHIDTEPDKTESQQMTVERNVPTDALYRAYLMCDRHADAFAACDLISDILSNGDSSRLKQRLIRKERLFTDIDASILGCLDRGLFILSGHPSDGVSMETAEKAIDHELQQLTADGVTEGEIDKVINKFEATFHMSHYRVADRAHELCLCQWLGDIARINTEPQYYRQVTEDRIQATAQKLFTPSNANTLHYLAK